MQDKPYNPDIDGAFEDKAWKHMEALLDKEMPTKKRKRRFIWWFFLAGVLIGVTIGSLFFLSNSRKLNFPDKIIAQSKTQEINTLQQKETQHLDVTQSPSENNLHKRKNIYPEKETQHLDITEATPKNDLSKQENIYPPFSIARSKNHEHIYDLQLNTRQLNTPRNVPRIGDNGRLDGLDSRIHTSSKEVIPPSSSNHSTIVTPNEATYSNKRSILNVLLLPSLAANFIDIPQGDMSLGLLQPPPPKTRKNPKPWSWGVQGTIGSFHMSGIDEYAFGIYSIYDISPKWSLQIGLQYHRFQLSAGSSGGIDVSAPVVDDSIGVDMPPIAGTPASPPMENEDMEQAGGMGTTSLDPSFNNTNLGEAIGTSPLIEEINVQYLSLPVLINYKLMRKFEINVGTHLYYGLKDYSFQSLNYPEIELKRWDLASSVGGSFSLTENLGVRFSYERGWFKKVNEFDFINQFADTSNEEYSPLEGRFRLTGLWTF